MRRWLKALDRGWVAVMCGLVVPLVVAAALVPFRGNFASTAAALVLVLVVVAVACFGNRLAGWLAALSAAAWFDFFLTKPYERFAITHRPDVETTVEPAAGRGRGHRDRGPQSGPPRGRVRGSSLRRAHPRLRRDGRRRRVAPVRDRTRCGRADQPPSAEGLPFRDDDVGPPPGPHRALRRGRARGAPLGGRASPACPDGRSS